MQAFAKRHNRSTTSLLLVLALTPGFSFADSACVATPQELDQALQTAAGAGGDWTIKVERGDYDMSKSVLESFEFPNFQSPDQLDNDQDGKLDVDDNIQYVLKDSTSISLQCGYAPKCTSRVVDADNTKLFDATAPRRLAIRVQQSAKLTISGCGFRDTMLWIVHGGQDSLSGNGEGLNPITGHSEIVLGRNKFSATEFGPELLIQEEGAILKSYLFGKTQEYRNLSTPHIVLRQNIFTTDADTAACAVNIGDRSGYAAEDVVDNYYFGDLKLFGRLDMLHNSIGGNSGCGIKILTQDPVYMANNIIAGNGEGKNDIYFDGAASLWSEFNLYNKFQHTSDLALTSIGDQKGVPGFRNAANGDLRLRSDSQALDHGTIASKLGEPSVDALDNSRIWGPLPDLGAYEFFMILAH